MVKTPTELHDQQPGYYGHPMIKPPEWTDLIPTYFFAGGLAGTAATLAFTQRLAKNEVLARAMLFAAAGGTAVSAFCLIADLKRPERFMNMLRVFKPTSPMSVGVYIFSAFGGSVTLAMASELTGVLRPIGRLFEALAALFGPPMSVYTAVLISDTVVPAWHYGRNSLPLLFACGSAMSAAGVGMLCVPRGFNGAARRLALAGGVGSLFALERLHAELGPRQDVAYKTGQAKKLSGAARALAMAGSVAALFAKRSDIAAKISGACLITAALCERFGIFRAGCISAKDPSFTIDAQRSRANA